MPKATKKKERGDGRLHITYNEMGQGDSILIKCPNGKVVVIDCGAARWDGNYFDPPATPGQLRERAIKVLFEPRFLGNDQTVNALILTHADKDHCNEVASIFNHTLIESPPIPKVTKIEALYFSGALNHYLEGNAAHYLNTQRPPDNSYAITVNQNEKKLSVNGANAQNIKDSAAGKAEINKKSKQNQTEGFIKILDGTDSAGTLSCDVYILASNVTTYPGINDGYADKTPEAVRNRSSVVTMVIYGDKKFLFLGDATYHTEKFLKDTYGPKINNLEMVHVGHHASYRTSSSYKNDGYQEQNVKKIDFVSHVNPKYLAVSAAYDSGSSLKLPRWETINNYIQGAPRLAAKNGAVIHCWWAEHKSATGSGLKRKKADWVEYEVDNKTTDRYVLCTGTDGAIDFDYKEAAGKARAYRVKKDGKEEFMP